MRDCLGALDRCVSGLFHLEILPKILHFLISLKSFCACIYMLQLNIQDTMHCKIYI